MEPKRECIGCLTYGKNCAIRRNGYLYDIKKCPCNICLLKVICQHACEEFKTYCSNKQEIQTKIRVESN